MEIRKFSQEGEPLGTPVDIYVPDMGVCQSINSCIEYAVIPPTVHQSIQQGLRRMEKILKNI